MKFRLPCMIGLSLPILIVLGCSTRAPLGDNLTLVPVSDKADIAKGLEMTYVYGINEGFFNFIACEQKNCWYSGQLALVNEDTSRVNALVVRVPGNDKIAWARSYQLDGSDAQTLGMLVTKDGGALLYGNAIVHERGFARGPLRPFYEKVDREGVPQWGGYILLGQLHPWSAFTDAIRLKNGGYAITGSGMIDGQWRGALLRLNPAGEVEWAVIFSSTKASTLSSYLLQMQNGHILAAGYNRKVQDIVLFEFAPDGRLVRAPVFHIRGVEVPVEFVELKNGPAIIAQNKMPSGEYAALLVQLTHGGHFEDAIRYRYSDGFNPFNVVDLPGYRICIYGNTEAQHRKLSLAFTVDKNRNPYSALALKGGGVFIAGARFGDDKLVFAGGRPLGVKEHVTGVITKWSPGVRNDKPVLREIRREAVQVRVFAAARAKEWRDEAHIAKPLQLSDLQTRTIKGNGHISSTQP